MKKLFIATVAISASICPISQASALSLKGNLGICGTYLASPNYGIQAELGVKELPLKVGGIYFPLQDPGFQQPFSFWGEYIHPITEHSSLGILAGAASYNPLIPKPMHTAQVGPTESTQPSLSPLVGLSYMLQGDVFWFRLTPNYVFYPNDPAMFSFFQSGVPLMDVGAKLTPHLNLSLRLSYLPLMLNWEF